MLAWRIPLGILVVATLVGLCWADLLIAERMAMPGVILLPLALSIAALATLEVCAMFETIAIRPSRAVATLGALLVVAAAWFPCWLAPEATNVQSVALAMAGVVVMAFINRMRCYQPVEPGGSGALGTNTVTLAAELMVVTYVGLLMSFVVTLYIQSGIVALASMLICVKMGDIGAYTLGRLIGRHPMAPVLSPKKTLEGAFGAILFACLAAWGVWYFVGSSAPLVRWLVFGALMGVVGMVSDLAESFLKRDVGVKDSSGWLPGFGGVLDMLDSPLMAAPAAYICWLFGLLS